MAPALLLFLKEPGRDSSKIRRSDKKIFEINVFKKIKVFLGISKLDEQLYEYLT